MAKFQFWNLVYFHKGHKIVATRPVGYAENAFWAELYWTEELHKMDAIPDVIPSTAVRAELVTNVIPDPE